MEIEIKLNQSRTEIPREAYLYWIHCNRCYSVYVKQKEKRHYLLACRHVVCEQCVTLSEVDASATPSYKCPMCSKLVRGRQLNNMMPTHIKELFHPEPWNEDLPICRIFHFQQKQRQHFIQGMINQERLMMQEAQRCKLARLATRTKFENIEKLRKERRHLENLVRALIEERKVQRMQAIARTSLPSTTDESSVHFYTRVPLLPQRPRAPPLRRSQPAPRPMRRIANSNPIRMPCPSVLSFTDMRNISFKL